MPSSEQFSKSRPIYLDYHSTTPVDRRVADRIYHYMTEEFGNASSVDHSWGDRAEDAVKQAAKQVAELVGADKREIVWISGATESINLAIQGSLSPIPEKPHRIALLPLEHKAVLDTCHILEKRGWAELTYLQVDSRGRLDLNHLEQVCAEGLSLICVMAANNEIGNIYPIGAIAQIAQRHSIPFLCDASQAVGKIPIHFEEWGITYLAISAHKLYGPKGCGALVVRKGHHLEPIIFGGGHQKSMRSGTLDVPSIVGLGEACRLRQLEMEADEKAIASKRDRLQTLLLNRIPGLVDLLQKSIFAPQPPNFGGRIHSRVPQNWGASGGYAGVSPSRAPGVDLGGIPGFMQEV
jgi:cysteine desulfurase